MPVRFKYLLTSILATFALVPMLMGPTGGLPSRPTFQQVTVLAAANQDLRVANTTVAGFAQIRASAGAGPATIGICANASANQCASTMTAGDSLLFARSGTIFISTDNGVTTAVLNGTITCATACNASSLKVGQTAIISKTAPTTRTSNATPALDPDLQFTGVPAGDYQVTAYLFWSAATGGGFQFGITNTAALTNGSGSNAQSGTYNGYIGTCTPSTSVQTFSIVTSGVTVTCTTTSTGFSQVNASMSASTSGTVGVNWAQNTSNASGTTLSGLGSWLQLTRVR